MNNLVKVYVGVHISKDKLNIHFYPIDKSLVIKNIKVNIKKFIPELSKYNIKQIAFVASGGYENLLKKVLTEKSYHTNPVDPKRVRAFIAATSDKAKTDAKKIAEFAFYHQKEYEQVVKIENEELLQSFVDHKNYLTKIVDLEKDRLQHYSEELCILSVKSVIEFFEKSIQQIDKKIEKVIKLNKQLF